MGAKDLVINPRTEQLAQYARNAQHDCAMLYEDAHKLKDIGHEWECDAGWNEVLKDMSYELEALNIAYGKNHNCHIRIDQLKEKFGMLRCYYNVVHTVPFAYQLLSIPLVKLAAWIKDNVNYKMKSVEVKPASEEVTIKELTEDEYEKTCNASKYANVDLMQFDGKFWEIKHLHSYAMAKMVPTKHKLLWWLSDFLYQLSTKTNFSHLHKSSKEDEVVREFLHNKAHEIVSKAEDRCYHVCERCGYEIGTNYRPRCQTYGWVTYICEQCAIKTGLDYIKDHKVFNAGNFVREIKDPELKEREQEQ